MVSKSKLFLICISIFAVLVPSIVGVSAYADGEYWGNVVTGATYADDYFDYDYIYEGSSNYISISDSYDYRWLKFRPTISGYYTFESYNNSGDPYATLYDAYQNELYSDDDGSGTSNFKINYYLESYTDYYLKCKFFNNGTGSYYVRVYNSDYDAEPTEAQEDPTYAYDETEPYVTVEDATSHHEDYYSILSLNKGQKVEVNSYNRETYFSFIPDASGKYLFESFNNTGDPYAYLYDSDMYYLSYGDNNEKGRNFNIVYELEKGETYYIRCTAADGNNASYYVRVKEYVEPSDDVTTPTSGKVTSDNVTGTLVDGKVKITSYTGTDSVISIPSSIDGYPVVSIATDAFADNTNIKTVTIPDGVQTIGAGAFSGCTSLTEVRIPGSVITIGNSAFQGCTSLYNIVLPDGMKQINDYTFYGCSALMHITFPDSIKFVYENAFSGCNGLSNVYYKGSSSDWKKVNIAGNNEKLKNANIYCTDGMIAAASTTARDATKQKPKTTAKNTSVKKDTVSISISKVKVKKSAKKLILKATVRINGQPAAKGTKVKFKFGSYSKNVKVGSKGVAKLTLKKKAIKKALKKTKVGKKVTFKVSYNSTTASKKFKVKK